MSLSLYDISVLGYLQTLGAVRGILDKALAHFQENGVDPEEMVETRMAPDMLPFRFQVQSVLHHSVGAVEAIKSGSFAPPRDLKADSYTALQALLADGHDTLEETTPAEINARSGADVVFAARSMRLAFTAESFVLSMSLPNLLFHATTTYNILRASGVRLGKQDFLGTLRTKG